MVDPHSHRIHTLLHRRHSVSLPFLKHVQPRRSDEGQPHNNNLQSILDRRPHL